MKVKLCGFTEKNSLQTAIDCKVDFLGFVFCEKSPRNLSLNNAPALATMVPPSIAKVAVVVEPSLELLQNISSSLQPQYFQLHGNIDFTRILTIKKAFPNIKIIKAFTIQKHEDLEQTIDFIDAADIFLFDSSTGGLGKPFDFKILQNFSCKKDWFLSGGLNINNINEALKITGAKMVDLSSGIEKERGKKSPELIVEFMHKIKNAD
jgi:phosphoribosylanthranilate isomerase